MITLIYRSDTHLMDHSPSSWKGDYPQEVWSNLRQVGKVARQYEARAVVDGGDFFNHKAPGRNPHSLITETVRIHRKEYPCPTFGVEGNHDLRYNRLDTIPEQPLGVLFESEVFQRLRDVTLEDSSTRVRVVGVPYSTDRTAEELRAIQKQPGDGFLVAVVHALAAQEPPDKVKDFFNEPVFRYDHLITKNGPDVWCFAHWHRDQGVVQIGGKFFVNQGALSRGALNNENIHRIPKISRLSFGTSIEIAEIPLEVAPSEEVFDLERKERQEAEHESIDAFVSTLRADGNFDPAVSIEDNLRNLSFGSDVKQMALDYLDRARLGVG